MAFFCFLPSTHNQEETLAFSISFGCLRKSKISFSLSLGSISTYFLLVLHKILTHTQSLSFSLPHIKISAIVCLSRDRQLFCFVLCSCPPRPFHGHHTCISCASGMGWVSRISRTILPQILPVISDIEPKHWTVAMV